MNIKKIFKYQPHQEYDFNIQTTENASVQDINSEKIREEVYDSVNKNLEFIQSKYNTLINSDIIVRQFSLICKCLSFRIF